MAETRNLTILQLNDSHGYLELHPEIFWEGNKETFRNVGGFARIATILNQIQMEQGEGVLTLDNGDTIHGTYPAVRSQGEVMVPILNSLALDAMTGHWEFAYGPAEFQRLTHKLDYPMLAINCYEKDTDTLIFSPGQLLERNGVLIGIIGIAATIVDKTMPPSFSEGIYFTLGNQELPDYVKHLREKERVDLIVILSHLGYPQDLKLAQEVDGIDVLLSGHTHNRLSEPVVVNGAIIIQSGCHGSFIGRLDFKMRDKRITRFTHNLIVVDETISPNPAVQSMIDKILKPHRSMLDENVGKTKTPLSRYRVLESTMDNLLLQSIMDISGAEIGLSNGWRYGAPIMPGQVTMNDLWNIVPENPSIILCTLKGTELLQLIEDSLEDVFSRDPYRQMGGYLKRGLGFNAYIKIENPYRKRIQNFYVGGKRLDPNRTYRACFLSEQGLPPMYGTSRREIGITALDALISFFAVHSPVEAALQDTFIPI